MQTLILIGLTLFVKWIDYRQTVWILGPGRDLGYRELNPLITHRSRILPVMGGMTALAIGAGLLWGDALLGVFLAVSAAIVIRNHWKGVRR